jgi:MSHA biogenesis protein MshQ
MGRGRRTLYRWGLGSLLGLLAMSAWGATCTSIASGSWNVATTWSGCAAGNGSVTGTPGSADTVIIAGQHTVTVDAASAALSLTLQDPDGSATDYGVTITGSNSLTVSNAITLPTVTSNNHTSQVSVGAGTLSAGSISIPGGTGNNRISQITVSTGTLHVTGSITFSGLPENAIFVSTGASTVNVGGDFSNGGTLTTTGTGTINFTGSGAQLIGAYTTYNNMGVSGGGTKTLGGAVTAGGVLTLTNGTVDTAGYTLTLSASCPGSYSRSGGYVIGNLSLNFPTGSPTCTYHVGDSIGYAPITVAMSGVSTAGPVVGRSDPDDHPNTVAGYSGINAAKSANHYWTLSTGSPAIVYTSYAATFQFCASTSSCVTPTEVDTGANTGNFIVARKASGAWTTPTVGSRTSYSIQATGLTGVGEFAVGEPTVSAPTLDHVRLEHPGSGCTNNPTQLTVKACGDASCASYYTGSVTVDLASITNGTWSGDPVTFSGGAVGVTLTVTAASTVSLGATATSPTAANTTRCFNGATETCALTVDACILDIVEVGGAAYTPIYTKLANVTFQLDGRHLGGGTQSITKVELVDASTGSTGCAGHTQLQDYTAGLPRSFSNGSPTYTFDFAYANAVANAKFRMTNSGGQVSCSSDNFSIRPQAFIATSSASNSGSSGTPVFRAGTDAFSVTATAVYSSTTTTRYDGTPKFDVTKMSTAQAHLGGMTGTTFPAATAGVSTATTFKYDEVGNFSLGDYAIYDDGYATVDSAKGECASGFSNARVGGKYSCKFGSVAAGPFGRFVPDHFTVRPTVANTCTAGAYTYLGQSFSLSTAGVVEARNAADSVTQNYAGAYAPGVVAFGAENADSGTDLGGALVFTGTGLALAGSWVSGVFTLTDSATAVTFSRPTTPVGPYDTLDLGLTVTDADVSTVPRVAGADMNPTVAGGTTFTYKKFSGSPLRMRYGRLKLFNAYGSERLALPMIWETQYWTGQSFVRHTLDSCTVLAAANIALDNYQSPPKAVPPLLSSSNLSTVTVGAISAGRGTITLAPTAYATGSVDLVANLGSTATPSNCASLSNGSSTSAGLRYLTGQWCGSANDRNPTARASFGVYKSPLIYRRENY